MANIPLERRAEKGADIFEKSGETAGNWDRFWASGHSVVGRDQKWSSIERIAENRFQAQFAPNTSRPALFRPRKQIGSWDSIILSIFFAFLYVLRIKLYEFFTIRIRVFIFDYSCKIIPSHRIDCRNYYVNRRNGQFSFLTFFLIYVSR